MFGPSFRRSARAPTTKAVRAECTEIVIFAIGLRFPIAGRKPLRFLAPSLAKKDIAI